MLTASRVWLLCLVVGYASAHCTFDDSILDGPLCPLIKDTSGGGGADYSACESRWFTFRKVNGKVEVRYRLIGEGVTESAKNKIKSIMQRFNARIPCLNIQKVNSATLKPVNKWGNANEVLNITLMKECYVGTISGFTMPTRQVVMEQTLCPSHPDHWLYWDGVFTHEMFHVFAFAHTHRRKDRDRYVKVKEANVDPKHRSQYKICRDCTIHGPYECGSIMHYKGVEFLVKPEMVFKPLDPGACDHFGSHVPTANDWLQLATKLGCGPAYNASLACPLPGPTQKPIVRPSNPPPKPPARPSKPTGRPTTAPKPTKPTAKPKKVFPKEKHPKAIG